MQTPKHLEPILDCPCGSSPAFDRQRGGCYGDQAWVYALECPNNDCGLFGPVEGDSVEEVIEIWNQMVTDYLITGEEREREE